MKFAKTIAAIAFVILLASCDLLSLFEKKGTVTGVVYDSITSGYLSGVTVTVISTNKSTTTNSSGQFTIEAPAGLVTLRFSKTGYQFADVSVTVIADATTALSEDVVGYPPLASGNYRFVLTWGENPSDLDSHLFVPISAIYSEVYYSNKTASDNSAYLDWDDTTGYGPETITITTQNTGTYYYSVYLYSGIGNIKGSGATVKVYNASGLWKTYKASDATGDSSQRWWRVCSLTGSTITSLNTFASSGE